MADLSRREADLALRIVDPARQQHDPDAIAHPLGTLSFGLYCTPVALAEAGSWQDLPFISWDDSWVRLPIIDWLNTLFPGRQPVLRTNSVETQYVAARGNLGAIMLPRFIGDKDRSLLRLETSTLRTERELWLLYHRDLKGSQRVLAMRDFLQDLVKRHIAAVAG
jgi:DNA-binding transcriptional LysR family regulator